MSSLCIPELPLPPLPLSSPDELLPEDEESLPPLPPPPGPPKLPVPFGAAASLHAEPEPVLDPGPDSVLVPEPLLLESEELPEPGVPLDFDELPELVVLPEPVLPSSESPLLEPELPEPDSDSDDPLDDPLVLESSSSSSSPAKKLVTSMFDGGAVPLYIAPRERKTRLT